MTRSDPATILALRDRAYSIWAAGLDAVEPRRALRLALARHPLPEPGPGGQLVVVAFGKAARAMCAALLEHLAEAGRPAPQALVVTVAGSDAALDGARVLTAGHPVPDAAGLAAGEAVMALLASLTAADRVVALISGGASALLPAPVAGVSLADKARVNELLLASGAGIGEMNLIRQNLSRLKGGGFLRLAAPASVTGLILSDVPGDDPRIVASGPTSPSLGDLRAARAALEARGLWDALPPTVRAHLAAEAVPELPVPEAENLLIGSGQLALRAMHAAGAQIHPRPITGDVEDAAREILMNARLLRPGAALAFSGETTVTLRGKGKGGRNQELALRFALLAARQGLPGEWAFASAGTDGRDGPTEAAGGIVDSFTLARMRAAQVDPFRAVEENDSFPALEAAGGLILTGPTGTNVADLMVFVRGA